MWAYNETFYQIYPIGFCGAPVHNDGVGVRFRALSAEDLHAELVMFAQPARLRALVTEHGGDVVHFEWQNAAGEPVFDKRTHDARRTLGL